MTKVGQLFRQKMVSHIKDNVEKNSNVFLLSYSKVSGNQMNILRKDLKKIGAQIYIARNSIAQIAFKDLEKTPLADRVEGQTAIVWSDSDSVEVSKVLVKFTKGFEGVIIQGGLLEERLLEKADVSRLADLPSKEVLQSTLLATIQAPLTRLASALNAKSRDILSILKQLSEKKGGE